MYVCQRSKEADNNKLTPDFMFIVALSSEEEVPWDISYHHLYEHTTCYTHLGVPSHTHVPIYHMHANTHGVSVDRSVSGAASNPKHSLHTPMIGYYVLCTVNLQSQ